MNKFSTSILAMMLLMLISACSTSETISAPINKSPTGLTPSAVITPESQPTKQTSETTLQTLEASEESTSTSKTEQNQEPTSTNQKEAADIALIADGTYLTKGTYRSPAQMEDVEFSFVMKSGKIESVELIKESTVPMSKKFQDMFMEGIKKEVIGKKLSEIRVFDRVNGSSLTPKGFNQAVAELKQKA